MSCSGDVKGRQGVRGVRAEKLFVVVAVSSFSSVKKREQSTAGAWAWLA